MVLRKYVNSLSCLTNAHKITYKLSFTRVRDTHCVRTIVISAGRAEGLVTSIVTTGDPIC